MLRRRLLLVDDDKDCRTSLTRLLQGNGFDIVPAGSVGEALAAADRYPCDLLITDLCLPDGSGHDLLRDLRELHGVDIPAIVISGFEPERARGPGVARAFGKPFDYEALLDAIREAVPLLRSAAALSRPN